MAPIAAYAVQDGGGRDAYLLIQHGSYQVVPAADQPFLESGTIVLYRGIQDARTFRFPRVDRGRLNAEQRDIWRRYAAVQRRILSDSVLSFNAIHDRAVRVETSYLLDRTWLSDKIAAEGGLDVNARGLGGDLWRAAHQGFALARWVAEGKFGPNFVMGKTPIGNIRITTFFAGEHEARIIDPDLVEFVEARGCEVERYDPQG